jgi:hypothetical protein
MQAEIARAQAAVQAREALGDSTRASLDIDKAKDEIEALKAKAAGYDQVGAAAKDSAIEVGYHRRMTEASSVADAETRKQLQDLAEEWRRLQRTIAAKDEQEGAQQKVAEEQKRAAEEAMREGERRARQFGRTVSSAVSEALDSLGQKGANLFQQWWDAGKRGLSRFIGDAVGQLAEEKFGAAFGVGPSAAATKQAAAGATMLSAAQMQLQAAMLMVQSGTWSTAVNGGVADASTVFNPTSGGGGLGRGLGVAAIIAGAGLTGYGVGGALYSTSHGEFGNYARGAVGGAAAGALTGAAIGTTVLPGLGTAAGAAIGAVTGFVAGILGVGSASKEAKRHLAELQKDLESSMAGLRATVAHNDLAGQIAQVEADREQRRRAIEEAYQGGGRNSENVRRRTELLAEMNALEDKYVEQLKEEAAAKSRYFTEDLDVRALRAQGLDKQADALDFQHQQQRELDEYRRTHDMTQPANQDQYARLQQVQAMEAQKRATDANTAAVNALTTTLTNAPSGFKIEPYIQQYAKAMPYPGQWEAPTSPLRPPLSPLNPPTLSRADSVGSTGTATPARYSFTLPGAVFQINGNRSGEEMLGEIAAALDDVKERTLGGTNTATRADALQRVTARRSTTVSIS